MNVYEFKTSQKWYHECEELGMLWEEWREVTELAAVQQAGIGHYSVP
jgi:hypothetical protein